MTFNHRWVKENPGCFVKHESSSSRDMLLSEPMECRSCMWGKDMAPIIVPELLQGDNGVSRKLFGEPESNNRSPLDSEAKFSEKRVCWLE